MIVSSFAQETTQYLPSVGTLALSSQIQADASGDSPYAASIISSVFASVKDATPTSLDQLQELGENALAAMFLIAFAQAMLALFQYRNNPKGALLVPPGTTEGYVAPGARCEECKQDTESWFFNLVDLESSISEMQEKGMMESMMPDEKGETSGLVKRINKALVLLVPFASSVLNFVVQRNIHLFHLGFFLSLSTLLDFPDRLFARETGSNGDRDVKVIAESVDRPIQRVVVLGDSLAAGVGTVDVFEEELGGKKKPDKGPSPVFPRVLAQRISENTGEKVHWRSAGIVGGDAKDVEGCLNIIQDEVDNGRPPDLVMIICGINDLKKFATNPLKNAGPKEFRARMIKLIEKVRDIAPGTNVVLPSIPTQMFRKDSPLNIFPLVFFLNTVVGLWDSQKKMIANKFPKGEVSYIGLDPDEVYDWYMSDPSKFGVPSDLDGDGINDTTLISRDGVHPNARCYAFWGASLGDKLSQTFQRKKNDDRTTSTANERSAISA